jgi:ATP-dependent Clp protease ATP-binding subunit ClpA
VAAPCYVERRAPAGDLPLTPRATRALEAALNEAVELEHERAGPEHILLSLVMDPTSLAARLLGEFEVGPATSGPRCS